MVISRIIDQRHDLQTLLNNSLQRNVNRKLEILAPKLCRILQLIQLMLYLHSKEATYIKRHIGDTIRGNTIAFVIMS